MATPSTGADSARSRLPSSTKGGASAEPTPANNAGGGSGWGDAGFTKGGTDGDGGGFRGYEGTGHGMVRFIINDLAHFNCRKKKKLLLCWANQPSLHPKFIFMSTDSTD